MSKTSRFNDILSKEISHYLVAILLCFGFLYPVLHLWSADFTIPFAYWGDATFNGALIKGTIENGWYMSNPFTGMPFGSNLYDFPLNCNLDMAIVKMISFVFPNWALVMNIYFLLAFPLTVITSLFAFKKMGVSPLPAIAGSLLYTFIPYHFMQGEFHINLSAYYLIPLIVLLVFWVFKDNFLFSQFKKSSSRPLLSLINRENLFSIAVCVLVASTFIYYSFFACFFLLIAGVFAAISRKRWQPLLNSFLLAGVIVVCVLAYNIPTLLHQHANGTNVEALVRTPQESETYGLKVIQLLLPVPGHRVQLFADISAKYAQSAPLVNENQTAALGLIGGIGFIVLIVWIFYRLFGGHSLKRNETFTKIDQISSLNLAAVLLGTLGGFGTVLAYAGFPQIRSYNRISVFIAFFSILAVVLLMDLLIQKYSLKIGKKVGKWIILVGVFAVVCLGIYDQTSPAFVPDYDYIKQEFLTEERFIKNIEASFPTDTMVFQLPYVAFPESAPLNRMADYDLFRGYLHSEEIRWSYGAIKGRDGSDWQKYITGKPADEMIQELSAAGFNGIYVDSYGYADNGKEVISSLSLLLNETPLISDDGRLYFFDMTQYNAR